ncbi:MAG TPA: hypothetical protein VM143_11940 [Acidimicrobiales bacterium]|nr:hypothetical protein [Acidimicrobiales bacterium]
MRRRLFVLILLAALLGAGPAGAAHWSEFGGDAGRSGAQPVDEGGVPAQFVWSRTGLADRDVRTSIITSSGGTPSTQRLIYGTDGGFILMAVLQSGATVGPRGGTDVSAADDPFGGGSGSVTMVESSTAGALGQVYAIVNEKYSDNSVGLQIVQVDEADGRVLRELDIPGTAGYRIQSSVLLTPVDAAGNRSLFFVAEERNGPNQKLFKIPLSNASSPTSTIGGVLASPDINANASASPTFVNLNDAAGSATSYVAVSTFDGILTFAVADLAAGPSSTGVGEALQTPSVPVGANGNPPALAPALYAASSLISTTVHKFTQVGNAQELTRTSSVLLPGTPAPGLAITAKGQRVLVSTSRNLFGLRASDLAVVTKYHDVDDLATGTTGFSRTTAAGTGDVVAIVTDGGTQLLLDRDTLKPVDADLFAPAKSADGSLASFGQPSISHRFLQMSTDRGIFVYGLRQASPPTGYWLAASDGGIFSYGDAEFFGSTGDITLNQPIVTMAATPSRAGYWLAASDGGIFTFGDARFFGSTGDVVLNKPVVGMVPTRSGLGYWLVASDGGVFAFGDAVFYGSTGDIVLNRPIVGMAATPTGDGYWLVASDGGIFAFGDAPFLGSTGDIVLNKPIVGMAALPAGAGYWMVASDGGVFSFGRAGFFGSTGDIVLNSPIIALTPSATGLGYLFTAADGGVFAFGDAPFLGSAAELGRLNRPVVTIAAKP